MTFNPAPDSPMAEGELLRAEDMLRRHEITQSDLAWLMGLEDDYTDEPPPRGFKSWHHFEAFKWHRQQRALGKPKQKRRKRIA